MTISVLIIALIILILFLFAPVKVILEYSNKKVHLDVYICGIKVFKQKDKKNTYEKKYSGAKEFETGIFNLKERINKFTDIYKSAVKFLKKHVSISLIKLDIKVGTGDAASAAIVTGSLWATVYSLIGSIGRIVFIDEHKVEIVPDFSNSVFLIGGKCIFKSRVVYIIIIAITILKRIKSQKGKEE